MEERNKKGKVEGRQGMGSRGLRTGNGSGDPHHFLGSRGVGGGKSGHRYRCRCRQEGDRMWERSTPDAVCVLSEGTMT